MQLNNLIHWRLEGTPDVFTEERDGHEWQVISHGKPYHAGLWQRVKFDRPIVAARLSAMASLFTTGSLMVRVGMNITGEMDPQSSTVSWSYWEGPDNGWNGKPIKEIYVNLISFTPRKQVAVFLESKTGNWPTQANTSRWRGVCLEVEYADQEPEPPPEPEPEPEPPPPPPDLPDDDPRKWALERMAEIQKEIVALVEQSVVLLDEIWELAVQLGLTEEERARALAWIAKHNSQVEYSRKV